MYKALAEALMFTGVKVGELESKYKLQFRKNKDAFDIHKALKKARKNGGAKIEFELEMLEIYLRDVLKPVKEKK